MNLNEIISITGRPGLFTVVAQGKNSVIVESIVDKKRIPAHASDRISTLGDISIYTTDEDVKLIEVFEKFNDKYEGKACPSHKEELSKLEDLLGDILPNYDRERVYKSDLRKIFQWYNILINAGIPIKEETEKEESEKKEAPKKAASKSPKKAAPKSGPKKSAKTSASKKSGATKTGSQRGK
jgi:hypothetical protein